MARQILEGIRVVEWSAWLVGPVAGEMLAQLGAEVIKIESFDGDPQRGHQEFVGTSLMIPGGRQSFVESANANKKSIAIDLAKPEGKQVVYDLIAKSDVFLTNMRPKSATKLGLDYQTLCQYNPQLIYAPATGFGERGPDSELPAFDILAQARAGLMMTSGEPGWPPVFVAMSTSDTVSGIMLAYGIVAALLGRERLGVGQEVKVSMLGATMALQRGLIETTSFIKKPYPRQQRAEAYNPLYSFYKCKDGKWLVLALLQSDRYWAPFTAAIGRADLEHDPRFDGWQKRKANRHALIAILDEVFATRAYAEWAKVFRVAEFLFSPVQDIPDLFSDPQVLENRYLVDIDHPDLGTVQYVRNVVDFGKTPTVDPLPAPHCGQNTEEVLLDICGYEWEKIGELKEQKVVC